MLDYCVFKEIIFEKIPSYRYTYIMCFHYANKTMKTSSVYIDQWQIQTYRCRRDTLKQKTNVFRVSLPFSFSFGPKIREAVGPSPGSTTACMYSFMWPSCKLYLPPAKVLDKSGKLSLSSWSQLNSGKFSWNLSHLSFHESYVWEKKMDIKIQHLMAS